MYFWAKVNFSVLTSVFEWTIVLLSTFISWKKYGIQFVMILGRNLYTFQINRQHICIVENRGWISLSLVVSILLMQRAFPKAKVSRMYYLSILNFAFVKSLVSVFNVSPNFRVYIFIEGQVHVYTIRHEFSRFICGASIESLTKEMFDYHFGVNIA